MNKPIKIMSVCSSWLQSIKCVFVYVCVCVSTLAKTAEQKAEVEQQLERRLSLRPTRLQLEQRNILKGVSMCIS